MKKDIAIIGGGPAGVSAALYAKRAGLDTVIISKGAMALEKAEKIDNYYGFPGGISGPELYNSGIEQAKNLAIDVVEDEVLGLTFYNDYVIKIRDREIHAPALIIATGTARKKPPIEGIEEFEGRGVSYCALCDGFFYKGKNVAVIGSKEYALSEAVHLAAFADSVTVLTHGSQPETDFPPGFIVEKGKISRIIGGDRARGALMEDGRELNFDGIFIAMGTASSSDLAKKIGAQTENGRIIVDEKMSTGLPGLYAAGDCTGGMLQIAKAVHEGAIAGQAAAAYVKSLQ